MQQRFGLNRLSCRSWGDRASASIADHFLRLGRVVTNILLCALGSARSMVGCEGLDLFGLLVGDIGGVIEMVIDELLV